MRARLADIATQAGVSEATVSRVLNDKPGVAAETRDAVLTALDVLGYERPSRLRRRSAGLIGLVVPELVNPIFPAFAQVIDTALASHGYTPVLCTQTPGGVHEEDFVQMLCEHGVSAHGLPRVVELFEARTPKGAAILARTSGVIRITDEDATRKITIVGDDGSEDSYNVVLPGPPPRWARGPRSRPATTGRGPKDPKQVLEIKGIRETQQYLVDEVQRVYRDQGVSIHDKHIELIVRQMLRRVLVAEQGESPFLPGERVDSRDLRRAQPQPGPGGAAPRRGPSRAHGHHQGVAGHRFVAVGGVVPGDHPGAHRGGHRGQERQLFGLKENIIIGKLIPAGTGMQRYRDVDMDAPEAERMQFWTSDAEGAGTEDLAAWLANIGNREAGATAGAPAWLTTGDGQVGDSSPEESAS